jgi:hypothetical protein
MWLAALRRLTLLVAGIAGATAAVSALLGLALGSSLGRALALGFYLVGSFVMVAGFFIGNRGPARVKSESAGASWVPFPLFGGSRQLRWASPGEQTDTINSSAVFIALGLILVLIGVGFDTRHSIT